MKSTKARTLCGLARLGLLGVTLSLLVQPATPPEVYAREMLWSR